MAIKPIETRYAGCRFRSRLEARWAVFFDAMSIPWQYEPQGFTLSSGRNYLPDFLLTECGTWVEVKGSAAQVDMDVLSVAAAELPEMPCRLEFGPRLMLLGAIPVPLDKGDYGWLAMELTQAGQLGSCQAGFGRYHKNSRPWFFDDFIPASSSDLACISTAESSAAQHGYVMARSARFEHGERGR